MKKRLFTSMLCAAVALMIFAVPDLAAKETAVETVGGFAVKLSNSLGTQVTSKKAAAEVLAAAGVNLKVDLDARLTQSEAARILAELGMKVAIPTDPNGELSVGASTQLAASAGIVLSAGDGIATHGDLPLQCLLEKNHGKCTNCCKDALAGSGLDKIARSCSKFCRSTEDPHPSDPEPQP